MTAIRLRINGAEVGDDVPPRVSLADFLRDRRNLTGTHLGCEHGVCGACTVLVNDRPVLSCLTLAASAHGRRVETVESLMHAGRLSAVQRGFHEKLGSQCGYCTPGFIMASVGLLRRNPRPTDAEIVEALGSNICRCTGYVKIIEALRHAAQLVGEGALP